MNELIQNLKTPEECLQLAYNVQHRDPALARDARRRSVELRALSHNYKNEVEKELLRAVYAYEEVLSKKNKKRTRASRTWQMINRHGLIAAAERAVYRDIEPQGYKILVEMGMADLTFEAVIIRYPDSFTPEVVVHARRRLNELENEGHEPKCEKIQFSYLHPS